MRTHGLYQTTNFLLKAARHGVRYDVSLFMPGVANLAPHRFAFHQDALTRVPYYWEDLHEMASATPDWSLERWQDGTPGVKIFNFHPIHIVLNSSTVFPYTQAKDIGPLESLSQEHVLRLRNTKKGAGSLFQALVHAMRGNGATIREICSGSMGEEACAAL